MSGDKSNDQSNDELTLKIVFSRRQLKGLIAIILVGAAAWVAADTITMTTSYPAPSGVYRKLISTIGATFARDSGSVGIGTTTPGSKLSVNGGVSVGAYASNAAPANGLIVSGNMGIGTTIPNAKLDVSGDINTTGNITASGSVRVGDDNTACTTSNAGALRLHTGKLQACIPNLWRDIDGSPAFTSGYADVTAARALNTTYTNVFAVPLFVAVTGQSLSNINQKNIFAIVNGSVIGEMHVTDANYSSGWLNNPNTVNFIVPPNATYQVNTAAASLVRWLELH